MEGTSTAKCGRGFAARAQWKVELTCTILGCTDCPYFNGTIYHTEDHKKADESIKMYGEGSGTLGNQ